MCECQVENVIHLGLSGCFGGSVKTWSQRGVAIAMAGGSQPCEDLGKASRQRGQLLTKPPGQQAVWLWLWAESEGAAVAHEQLGLAAVDSPDLDHQEVGAIWRGSKTVSYNQI